MLKKFLQLVKAYQGSTYLTVQKIQNVPLVNKREKSIQKSCLKYQNRKRHVIFLLSFSQIKCKFII